MTDISTEIFVRYFHFLAIFSMFSLLTCQHLLLKKQLEAKWFKTLAIVDIAHGVSALIVLICGVSLWFFVGKPASFYAGNWALHTKITLFVLIGLISIAPTLYITKLRRCSEPVVSVPKYITMCLRFELLLLCIIPLLAVIMSYGAGY